MLYTYMFIYLLKMSTICSKYLYNYSQTKGIIYYCSALFDYIQIARERNNRPYCTILKSGYRHEHYWTVNVIYTHVTMDRREDN